MNKINLKLSKTLIIFLMLFLTISCTTSCTTTKEPIEKYCGGIVVLKSSGSTALWFILKYNGKFTSRIYLYEIDFDKYNVSDTIKCSPTDSLIYKK